MPLTESQVTALRLLAAHADLPLPEARFELVGGILFAWTADANALSQKMSAAENLAVAPITGILQTIYQGEDK